MSGELLTKEGFSERQVCVRILVESLRRMYANGKIAKEMIEKMLILTEVEKHYILSSKGENNGNCVKYSDR